METLNSQFKKPNVICFELGRSAFISNRITSAQIYPIFEPRDAIMFTIDEMFLFFKCKLVVRFFYFNVIQYTFIYIYIYIFACVFFIFLMRLYAWWLKLGCLVLNVTVVAASIVIFCSLLKNGRSVFEYRNPFCIFLHINILYHLQAYPKIKEYPFENEIKLISFF
jgi:hypothetical protein